VLPRVAESEQVRYGWAVSQTDFSDAALVIVGHGSTLNPESSAPTYQHADTLRERRIFAQVLECFWKLEPSIAGVLRAVFAPRVFIVPLFISDGYFTEEVIPRELGFCQPDDSHFSRIQRRGGQVLHYCAPVGTHDSMTRVLLARAEGVVRHHPFPNAPKPEETTLFVVGHGTTNNENSRQSVERQAERIRSLELYAAVQAVYMDEEPRVQNYQEMAVTKNIVVVPFFISDGLHSYTDIPVMLGAAEAVVQARYEEGRPTWRNPSEIHGKRVWYSASIGAEPLLADVILERVQETAQAEVC